MAHRFVARAACVVLDPGNHQFEAGISENPEGTGFSMCFMTGSSEPATYEQDRRSGLDTYSLMMHSGGHAYGCISEVAEEEGVLRVVVQQSALEELGLGDVCIEAELEVPAADLAAFCGVLPLLLDYGRGDARPARIDV